MLYALNGTDVVRLRKLLIAFEQGRLLKDTPPPEVPSQAGRQDVFVLHVVEEINGATVVDGQLQPAIGPATLSGVDYTQNPPVVVDTVTDQTFNIANLSAAPIPPGYYPAIRDPTSGYFILPSFPTTMMAITTPSWSQTTQQVDGVIYYQAYIVPAGSETTINLSDLGNPIQPNGWLSVYGLGWGDTLVPGAGLPSPYFWYPCSGDSFQAAGTWNSELTGPSSYQIIPLTFTDSAGLPCYVLGGFYQTAPNTYNSTAAITCGPDFIALGALPNELGSAGAGVNSLNLYVSASFPQGDSPPSTTVYQGATGMDGVGNIFVSGLNCTVGGPVNAADDGSYW
jgi:hypothetical protein